MQNPTAGRGAIEQLCEQLIQAVSVRNPQDAAALMTDLAVESVTGDDLALGALILSVSELVDRWNAAERRLGMLRNLSSVVEETSARRRQAVAVVAGAIQQHCSSSLPGEPVLGRSAPDPVAMPDLSNAEQAPRPRSSGGMPERATPGSVGHDGSAPLPHRITLLGRSALVLESRAVTPLPGSKAGRVLRYLMSSAGRPVPGEVLLETFWPDSGVEAGRRGLHQAVYLIRRALRDSDITGDWVRYHDECYVLEGESACWCDVEVFEGRARRGLRAGRDPRSSLDELQAAIALYGGDFVADQPYEEWTFAERDRLRMLFLAVLDHAAELHLLDGDVQAGLELTRRALSGDPANEVAHRRAMWCLSALGRPDQMAGQYQRCCAVLSEEMELAPSLRTHQLYAELSSGVVPEWGSVCGPEPWRPERSRR